MFQQYLTGSLGYWFQQQSASCFPSEKRRKRGISGTFNLYASKIYAFALSYLKNNPDAEELVQDVFMKIWEKRENLDPMQNIKAYLFKIAVNTVYDYDPFT